MLRARLGTLKHEIVVTEMKFIGESEQKFSFTIPKGSKAVRMEDGTEFGSFILEDFTSEMKADPELICQLESAGYVIRPEDLDIEQFRQPDSLTQLMSYVDPSLKDGWLIQHINAIGFPTPIERGFLLMLRGWLKFADTFNREVIGPSLDEEGPNVIPEMSFDHYTGPLWAQIGWRLNSMLSTELGSRLDMGTLSSILCKALKQEGYNMDTI